MRTIMRLLNGIFHVETLLVTGALLLMTSSVLGWVDRPIMGWLTGFEMPLSKELPATLSYGIVCFSAGLISLLAIVNRFRWLSIVTGGVALLLALHFLLAYAILNAKDIILVNELNQQEARMVFFSNKNLPNCFMINPTFDPAIKTDTIIQRLHATIHFSTFGWYASVLGSAFILIVFLKGQVSSRIKTVTLILLISGIFIYAIISTMPAFMAEYHKNRGDYFLGTGMYLNALTEYEVYKNMDVNSNYIMSFHNHIGKAYYFTGRPDMADALIYRGSLYMNEDKFPLAIYYYTNALSSDFSISNTVATKFIVLAYIKYGLSHYRNDMKNSAIESWKHALQMYPLQIEAYYYFSKAYYDLSSYEESVMAGLQFMKLCRNKIRNAEMSCNVGDSYHRLKEYQLAREFYLKSIKLVADGNQRALMNLVGR
jgi:tetratricopeptide (TPR) repeat protein